MAKTKTAYFCSNCGAESPKWIGRCNACGEWNTFQEEIISTSTTKNDTLPSIQKTKSKPVLLPDIEYQKEQRINTFDQEFNRVLGGGMVHGSLVLVGGEPGIGKSTLMLQMALRQEGKKVLYVSGEESEQQIKMRADRIGTMISNCYILTETAIEQIINHIVSVQPDIIIIDSIQTLTTSQLESAAGTVSQIRTCAGEFLKIAKQSGIPIVLIGHITKDGHLAGPKILEHMVDTVLYFEGEKNYGFRIVRAIKNRYGNTSELGIYEMKSSGLHEVPNPSEYLLSQREEYTSGVAIACSLEGVRPLLIEIQALVSKSVFGNPQRTTTGFDGKRLSMLLAVLEKKCGIQLSNKDVFLNVAGGIKVSDPAVDLAVVAAIVSSYYDKPIHQQSCFAAEVGLSGEIRQVAHIEQRMKEAEKLGFEHLYLAKQNAKNNIVKKGTLHHISRIEQLIAQIFKDI